MAKKKTFEESLNRLDEITTAMENEKTTLQESMKLYKEGVELASFCSEFLSEIEQEVKVLQKRADGIFKLSKFNSLEEY